jgi:uncharacterized protein YkwD
MGPRVLEKSRTLAFTILLLASCARPAAVRSTSPRLRPVAKEIDELVDMINDHRKKIGCRELKWDTHVATVAQAHSEDMVKLNYFSHKNLRGKDSFARLGDASVRFWKAGENIAAGQITADEVFSSWLNSAGHRRNIEDCSFTYHGIGLYRGTPSVPYGVITNAWTHVFIVPRS